MRKGFSHQKKSIFFQLLFSNLIVCVFAIILISVTVYFWFNAKSSEATHRNNCMVLNNTAVVMDNYISTAQRIAKELSYSEFIRRLFYSDSDVWNKDMFVTANSIVNSMTANSAVDSIYICTRDRVVLSTSKSVLPNDYGDSMLALLSSTPSNAPFLTSASGTSKKYLTVISGEISAGQGGYQNAVIVNIDIETMRQALYPEFAGQNQEIIVLDKDGSILFSQDRGLAGSRYASDRLLDVARQMSLADQMNLVQKENGRNYVYDVIRDSGFIYIYRSSYWTAKSYLLDSAFQFLMLSGLVLLLAVIGSVLTFNSIYRPINQIFLNIKTMFKDMPQGKPVLSELELLSDVTIKAKQAINMYEDERLKKSLEELLKISRPLTEAEGAFIRERTHLLFSSAVIAAVVKVCGFREFIAENTAEDVNQKLLEIKQVLDGSLEGRLKFYSLITDQNQLTFLFDCGDSAAVKEEFSGVLEKNAPLLEKPVCVGVSDPSENLLLLPSLYDHAGTLTDYSVVFGKNSVIDESIRPNRSEGESISQYVVMLKNCITQNDKPGFCETLSVIHPMLSNLGYVEMMNSYIRIIQELRQIGLISGEKAAHHTVSQDYAMLVEADDFSEIRQTFDYVFDSIAERLTTENSANRRQLLRLAIEKIRGTYTNPELTASSVAEEIGVSSNYFSRMFKEAVGVSFPEYVNKLRLEHAVGLLTGTDEDIIAVSLKAGFNNPSYFSTIFKKAYGITPTKYRINAMKK